MSDQVWSREWLCLPWFLSPDKTYAGLLDHEKLFRTENGKSFKCKSDNLLLMSSQLQVKLVPMQMQAFTLPKGQFGKGDCSEWRKLPETCLIFTNVLLKHQLHILFWLLKHFSFPFPRVSEVECWADYNKRVIPIIIGAVVVCLLIIAVLTFLFVRDRRREGYDTLWAGGWSEPAQRICCTNIWIQHVLLHLHFW